VTGISQAEVDRARLLEPRCSVTLSGWQVIIPVDSGKVAAIIRNLLDNALHAAGPGGGILVALKVEGARPCRMSRTPVPASRPLTGNAFSSG